MSHFNIFNWVVFFPILLSVVSFSKFVRDVRKEHDPSFRPFKRNSNILIALGFAGLAGSVLLVIYGLQADQARQLRERTLTGQLVALNSDNVSLRESQAKLLQSNTRLTNLVLTLHERVEKLQRIAGETVETSQRIENTAASLEEEAEENAERSKLQMEAAQEQAELARKIEKMEKARSDQEERCIFDRKTQNEYMLKFHGCVAAVDSQQSQSRLTLGSQAVGQPFWGYNHNANYNQSPRFNYNYQQTVHAGGNTLHYQMCTGNVCYSW